MAEKVPASTPPAGEDPQSAQTPTPQPQVLVTLKMSAQPSPSSRKTRKADEIKDRELDPDSHRQGTLQIKRRCLSQRASDATMRAWNQFGNATDTALGAMGSDAVEQCRRRARIIKNKAIAASRLQQQSFVQDLISRRNLNRHLDLIDTSLEELGLALKLTRQSVQTMGLKAVECRMKLGSLLKNLDVVMTEEQEGDLDYIMNLFADAEDEASGRL